MKELKTKSEVLGRIKKKAEKKTVTLLFSGKDSEHDNATVMKELLSQSHSISSPSK
jgi:uncharacterized protein YeaO (DUF488 family)